MGFLDRLLGRSGRPEPDEAPRKAARVPDTNVPPQPPGRPDDPRGGKQSAEYRTADPRDVVERGGTLMAGPGGTPQDEGPSIDPRAPGLETPEEHEEPGDQDDR